MLDAALGVLSIQRTTSDIPICKVARRAGRKPISPSADKSQLSRRVVKKSITSPPSILYDQNALKEMLPSTMRPSKGLSNQFCP